MNTTEEVERRDREIIRLRLQGFTVKRVADLLNVKPHVVHDAIDRVYKRLGVHGLEELYGAMLEQEVAS
jgi:DNA-binding NarL/FixJ family response regulator